VDNTNSTILEFQGSLAWLIWWDLFHLIWEVKKRTRVCHTRERRRRRRTGRAGHEHGLRRGVAWRGRQAGRRQVGVMCVTEPPKSLGPPTVVIVQRTSDNPAGAPDYLTSSVSEFLTFPRAFHPSHRHYNSSEIRKCGSSYNNLLLLKSKTELYSYRPEQKKWVLSIIITKHRRQKPLPNK
jgi:hypothetical protein